MSNTITKATETAPVRAESQNLAVRPRVDVFENDRELLVVADVPGARKDSIDVRFEGGELRLEARRAPAPDGQGVVEEYRAADYHRAFAMPEGIDSEKIEAELANGVLTVHLPKTSAKRPRRIDVRAS
jgi:HSP20 family molecular chaperone IbpA